MSEIHKNLPEGWKLAQLSDIARVNPSRSFDLSDDAKITFLAMPDVTEEGRITNRQEKTVAEVKSGFTHFADGDILVAKITPCFENGKGALVHGMANGVGFGSTEFHVIRPIDAADREFIFHHTTSHEFRVRGELHMVGSAGQKRVPADYLREYIFGLPPVEERVRITEALRTWDDAIALQARQLQQLRRRKKEVAFRLLTKQQRLAGFTEDWEAYSLGEYFERLTTRNAVGNTNVLTISAQQGLVSQMRYFNKSIASEVVSNYYLLNRGDFAYNKSYSSGYPMGVIKPLTQYEQGIVSPLYICLRPITEDGDFFEHYFEAGMMNRGLSQIAQEGARNHGLLNVSAKEFMELDTLVPPTAERRAIAEVLNVADAEISLSERKLQGLRDQKRGLLQQLLTGQVLLS